MHKQKQMEVVNTICMALDATALTRITSYRVIECHIMLSGCFNFQNEVRVNGNKI